MKLYLLIFLSFYLLCLSWILGSKSSMQLQESIIQCLKLKSNFPELNLDCAEVIGKEQNKKKEEGKREEMFEVALSSVLDTLNDIENKVRKSRNEIERLKNLIKSKTEVEQKDSQSDNFAEKVQREKNSKKQNENEAKVNQGEDNDVETQIEKPKPKPIVNKKPISKSLKRTPRRDEDEEETKPTKVNNLQDQLNRIIQNKPDKKVKLSTKTFNDLQLNIDSVKNNNRPKSKESDVKEVEAKPKRKVESKKEKEKAQQEVSSTDPKNIQNLIMSLINKTVSNKSSGNIESLLKDNELVGQIESVITKNLPKSDKKENPVKQKETKKSAEEDVAPVNSLLTKFEDELKAKDIIIKKDTKTKSVSSKKEVNNDDQGSTNLDNMDDTLKELTEQMNLLGNIKLNSKSKK